MYLRVTYYRHKKVEDYIELQRGRKKMFSIPFASANFFPIFSNEITKIKCSISRADMIFNLKCSFSFKNEKENTLRLFRYSLHSVFLLLNIKFAEHQKREICFFHEKFAFTATRAEDYPKKSFPPIIIMHCVVVFFILAFHLSNRSFRSRAFNIFKYSIGLYVRVPRTVFIRSNFDWLFFKAIACAHFHSTAQQRAA